MFIQHIISDVLKLLTVFGDVLTEYLVVLGQFSQLEYAFHFSF